MDAGSGGGGELELMYYPLGPLAPDRNPRLNDQLLRVADGVYSSPDGYRPVGQWSQVYSALPAAPKGGASFVSPQGSASIVAGTAAGLYRAYSGGFTALATGYSIQGEQRWRFAQFGGLAIATNGADPMQKIDLSDMTVSVLGGSPPKFEALAVVGKGFLVGTVMNGDVSTLAWCAAFNAEQWNFGAGQSDYQTLPTGGRINGIFSGESGLILQRDRLVAMDYIGGNNIFDFPEVSSNIGCVSVHSTAQWGRLGFFLSDEGWMMWNGGLVPIGREWIDAEFRTNYDVSDWPNMSTAIDPVRGVLHVSVGDKHYIYDWQLQRWTTAPYASPIIFSGVTKGISIDEDEPGVANDSNIDGSGLDSLDDPRFRGGDPRLWVFNSSFALGAFTGTPMAATFTMADLEQFPGKRADVREVRPDIDCSSGLTVTLACKQRLADAFANVVTTDLRISGDMPIRASGRYIRPTIAVAAGTSWGHARGIEIVAQPGAGR
jgi:hypothetical protein